MGQLGNVKQVKETLALVDLGRGGPVVWADNQVHAKPGDRVEIAAPEVKSGGFLIFAYALPIGFIMAGAWLGKFISHQELFVNAIGNAAGKSAASFATHGDNLSLVAGLLFALLGFVAVRVLMSWTKLHKGPGPSLVRVVGNDGQGG
jgi:positive regulator of sigma E activity